MPKMWPWTRPSTTDGLLEGLLAQQAAQTAALTEAIKALSTFADIQKAQSDAILAPVDPPKVRLMTPDIEAAYARERGLGPAGAGTPLAPPDTVSLLADLQRTTFAEIMA